MPETVLRGFFGKIPSKGDFVGRGLPPSFQRPWEAWATEALRSSRALLGEAWTAAWLRAPVWRFVLPGGACGPDAALGVVLPSIDRVGRGWPLMAAAVLRGQIAAPEADQWRAFLDQAEEAARDAVAADLEPDMLADRISRFQLPESNPAMVSDAAWWTDGAPGIPARRLLVAGLPPMPGHAALLAGGDSP